MSAKRILAMTEDGKIVSCSASGREDMYAYNHMFHIVEGETATEFAERVMEYQEENPLEDICESDDNGLYPEDGETLEEFAERVEF